MTDKETPEYDQVQKNQRNNLRAPLIVEKIPCEDAQKTFFGYAKNISSGGLFIATVKPREPGEKFIIQVTIPAPKKIQIRCTCEVVWKRHFERKSPHEPGMGLKFLDLEQETIDRIDTWVKSHPSRNLV